MMKPLLAAALLLVVSGQEARQKEIAGWIEALGHDDFEERGRAQTRLVGLGDDLLHAMAGLAKAGRSPDAEIRTRTAAVRTQLLSKAASLLSTGLIRRAVDEVRGRWNAKDFKDLEEAVRGAFRPVRLSYVRFVPRLEVGDHLESDNQEDFLQFKPASRLGGRRDLLTQETVDILNANGGVCYVNVDMPVAPSPDSDLEPIGYCLIFTLPGGKGWSSYVVIGYGDSFPGWKAHAAPK